MAPRSPVEPPTEPTVELIDRTVHEIGTPLAVILGRAAQLEASDLPREKQVVLARTIARQVDRISAILAGLQAGKPPEDARPAPPAASAEVITEVLMPEAATLDAATLAAVVPEAVTLEAATRVAPTPQAAALWPRAAAGQIPDASSALILVVEDDPDMNRFVCESLSSEHRVATTFDGGQGLKRALELKPDLILTDITMPGMSGDQLVHAAREHHELDRTPIVLLSARNDDRLRVQLLRDGAQDYLTKPFSVEELRARIDNLFAAKRAAESEARLATARVHAAWLEAENRQLQEASRLKSEFVTNMSHELRTPLNAILGFAELLRDAEPPVDGQDQRDFLGHIITSGQHLLHLINEVLDLAKVSSGKLEFAPTKADLEAIFAEVVLVLGGAAEAKRIPIGREVSPELVDVVVDPTRLKQVLYNFVSNALKFTPDGGHVVVRALPDGPDRFRIEVQDTGIGIPLAEQRGLFADFHQVDGGLTKRYAGTGLGLAIVKRLVDAQGGTVGVESEPGRGSTFHAVLPRHPRA